MKIAYYIGSLNRGGMESLILDMCHQYKSAPYEMICICRYEGTMAEDFRKSGVPLIHLPKNGMLQHIWALRQTIKREKIDIVHSQSAINTMMLSVALLGTRIKIITTFHGNLFADASWWKRKLVYSASRKIICVSEYQKRYYERKWRLPEDNKLEVVYNGIDFSKIDNAAESGQWTEESSGVKLAMVGNFVKGRSPMIVVKGIHELAKQNIKDFDFYFIGRRDQKEPWRYDECVQYCAEHRLTNVHFLGAREDVPSILNLLDGFVYSTEYDSFGIAVIEAMASGLPVVVNDWPVMSEVCGEENAGVCYFKTGDYKDCALKIKELLGDIQRNDVKLNADCQKATEQVRSKYSIITHIKNLYTIYNAI